MEVLTRSHDVQTRECGMRLRERECRMHERERESVCDAQARDSVRGELRCTGEEGCEWHVEMYTRS